MAVLHLPENEIIWGNDAFYVITGLTDATRYQTMDAIIPGFTTEWLREGRSELPGDQTIAGGATAYTATTSAQRKRKPPSSWRPSTLRI